MKTLLFALSFLFTFTALSQEKVRYNLLNRKAPQNYGVGIKLQGNYTFPQQKIISDGSDTESIYGSENAMGGLGFYYRYDFTDRVSIQTELMGSYRSGSVTTERTYEHDTMIYIKREDLSNYDIFFLDIPVYLKFRWEFIPTRTGHWKNKSALGLYFGPRMTLAPYSKRAYSAKTLTRLYDQESIAIDNEAERFLSSTKFSPLIGVGASLGVDYELYNGFLVHASFYRSFTSYALKETRTKIFDNRLELGIGYRFN